MLESFEYGLYHYNNKSIPLVRSDNSKDNQVTGMEAIRKSDLPMLFVGFKKKLYAYKGNPLKFEDFLHFMNRIIDPVPILISN